MLFALFFQAGDFVAQRLHMLQERCMRLASFGDRRIRLHGDTRLPHKLLEKSVHGFETVGVAYVVPEQYVVLEEEDLVLPSVEKHDPVFQQLIDRPKIFPKQRAARFGQHVVFHFREHLLDLQAHAAYDASSRRLQFGEPRLDDVRLLAAFEVLAPLSNPLFSFEDQVSELIRNLLG